MRLQRLHWPVGGRDRLLVVCDPGGLTAMVRGRYPDFNVSESPSYLGGIAALANQPVRGLLVGVNPTARKLDNAIAGLRRAAGTESRIVLCCTPGGEPATRRVLTAGANDYVIYPPRGEELDTALGLRIENATDLTKPMTTESSPTWEELSGFANMLSGLSDDRQALLERICRWVADAMRSAHVRVLAGELRAVVGDPTVEPTLAEPITAGGKRLGDILVGPRQKSPFCAAEAMKLRHYSQLVAHLLDAAEQQQSWQSLAMIDEVTQCPNRRYLMHALEQLLQRAGQQRFQATVLLYDLDGFKHFNDQYGHAAGDQVLRETSRLFRKHCREHDIVARYAGDEFVVVFWDAEEPRIAGSRHPTDVLAVLRRITKAIQSHEFPLLGPEARGFVTVSGGLATYPWDGRDVETLLGKADEALLEAKRAGKNRFALVGRKETVNGPVSQPKIEIEPGVEPE